jgi:hypothetical protein
LKQEFKQAAETGDDLLLVKKKKKLESDSEQQESEEQHHLVTDKDLLARFYGANEDLEPTERFLRNYILNEGWKDKSQMANFDDPKLK